MRIQESTVKKIRISEIGNLDPITVILEDLEPRKGKIIIECYGKSWSAYWEGMGNRSIAQFFCSCNTDYLSGSLDPGLQPDVKDFDSFPEEIRKRICQMRRQNEINTNDAREWYDEADCVLGQSSEEGLYFYGEYLSKIFDEEWWSEVPKKPNPDYEYLRRIILTTQEALRSIELQENDLPKQKPKPLQLAEHLKKYIHQVGGYNSEFAHNLSEAVEFFERIANQEPVKAILVRDTDHFCHEEFGDTLLATIDCVRDLYTAPPVRILETYIDVDAMSEIIRKVDGNHTLGAGALAEKIIREMKDKAKITSKAPSTEIAYAMGVNGGPVDEGERRAFEAWMRGHCWSVSSTWNGFEYEDSEEHRKAGCIDPSAMYTRRLWAVWRDRAALAAEIGKIK